VHHLGQRTSKLLAAEIDHVLDLKDWDLEKYQTIKDIGPVVAKNTFPTFSRTPSNTSNCWRPWKASG
jgi:DNA ligase (NAD+)